MRSETSVHTDVPTMVPRLHDELVLEAEITLREALARIESHRLAGDADACGEDATRLVATALELLHRAEGVHDAGGGS